MTELEYIRSLDDLGLATYILSLCITMTEGALEDAGVEFEPTGGIPEEQAKEFLQALQQPHKEVSGHGV